MTTTSRLVLSLLAVGLAAGLGRPAPAQERLPADSAKRVNIRRLLALQRTDSLMLVGMELAMSAQAGQQSSDMPAGFMEAFIARARREVGGFVERLVPIYDSLYTADDVTQMIAFYQTPLGRRLLETQPALATATSEVGRQWGMELAGQVLLDLSRRPRQP